MLCWVGKIRLDLGKIGQVRVVSGNVDKPADCTKFRLKTLRIKASLVKSMT